MHFNLLLRAKIKVENKELSIIIVNYNNPALIESCLKSIDKYLSRIKKEIVVVDNNSSIHNLDAHIKHYPDLRVIYLPANMGFGYANNVGVKNAIGNVLFLMNSDAEFIDNTFYEMYSAFCSLPLGEMWGARLIWPDGKFQKSYSKEIDLFTFLACYTRCSIFFRIFFPLNDHKYSKEEFLGETEVHVVYGAAVLINKLDYQKIGGFSEIFFMYFEDVDLCDRFRNNLGGTVKFSPITTLIHKANGSSRGSSINYIFMKSKYLYGINKFGYLPMLILIPLDIILVGFEKILRKVICFFGCRLLK